jgi:hypothetical protein
MGIRRHAVPHQFGVDPGPAPLGVIEPLASAVAVMVWTVSAKEASML